ncbi:hypothetical protein A9Q79_05130 [Methylophaga sp. 42_25_T18]|nr:hypothetical protein A9Q79_05130 [Methylophaga sp. 42_25_T18]
MSKPSLDKHASFLSSEDLLILPDRRSVQNWLLTYIDVFVLIVMIFAVLVAISNFQTDSPIEDITKTDLPQQTTEDLTETDINSEEELLLEQALKQQTIEQEIQEQLTSQLEFLGLADSIDMTVTKGYAQLTIDDRILYESSQAELTELGQAVLMQLTPLLQEAVGLIYIEGHTDDRPINTSKYPSNWELGAARATSVLHFLTTQNIEAASMRAVSYAHTQPIADNQTDLGRQENRRVNIVIKVSDRID